MSTPFFRFKHFTVWHDRCAMKVNTDGVLLATWCPLPQTINQSSFKVLDIGTGSGLIALIIAQRLCEIQSQIFTQQSSITVDAIDIDTDAINQAADNFIRSPFSHIINIHQTPIQTFNLTPHSATYDLIISNPPYFQSSLKNPNVQRAVARHTDTLSYDELIIHSARLLKQNGKLALILPIEAEGEIISLAKNHHLYPTQITYVHTKPGKPAKRLLIVFNRLLQSQTTIHNITPHVFYIESENSSRSEEYRQLTDAFYLS